MLISFIELITFIALVFYIIFGGADYGAGILELFKSRSMERKDLENVIAKAIGPVWEANHIWLILIIVILFNGFPLLYTTITTYLHIPVVMALTGIVLRGVAFILRYYDIFENRPERMYTATFSLSSIWTSMWLGIMAGALILGRINPAAQNFYDLYVNPWLNIFSFSVGLFLSCVFTYLASSFLTTETEVKRTVKFFRKQSKISNLAVVISGGIVFACAYFEDLTFLKDFFSNPYCLLMMVLATLCWLIQISYRYHLKAKFNRPLVVGQVVFILVGFFIAQSPLAIATATGGITMAQAAAPFATLYQLTVALVVGLILILPSLIYLFWIFKFDKRHKEIGN